MNTEILVNRHLSEALTKRIREIMGENDPPLFAVLSSIGRQKTYRDQLLIVSADRLLSYCPEEDRVEVELSFCDLEEVLCKRMYGNGMIRARRKGEDTPIEVFRFPLDVASLCDAAVGFMRARMAGDFVEDAMEAVNGAFLKQLSLCPKCGRMLSAPGVPCVQCMNKRTLLKKLVRYIKPETRILLISVLIAVVTTALTLLPPLLTRTLVDDILPNARRDLLAWVAFSLIGVHFVQYGLSAVRGYLLRGAGNRIVTAIRCDVYRKAQYLPMRFYDKTSTGSVINRISSDTATLQAFMLRMTQEVVVQLFKLVGIVVVMLCINWRLTLLSLFPVPLVVLGSRIFRKRIAPYYRRIWRRSTSMTSVLTDSIPGIRVTKSFANEENATERFADRAEEWERTSTKAGVILNIYPSVVNFLINLGSVVIWSLGGNLVIDSLTLGQAGLSVGVLVSFISYASLFYGPVDFFANLSDSVQNAAASTERILDILDAEAEHDFGKGNTAVDMGGRIEFRNVSFSFDRTKKVLKNINLVIEPGDVVGVVGTTGSGKSTLVNLLLRYYDHYEGQITVDGVDIRQIDMQYYRSSIGFVQQEPMMFHDTIYNNIAYGTGEFTVDQVIHAADIANAHEFIIRQPDGYDSVLGERGVGLSGGERQRLSIARAVLRDPRMLVFDEATASVDSETEHLIQSAIEQLISGRTTIMIAHRLSTLSKANKIVVVDNGSIIECGTPAELMEKKGKYYRLVQIQSMSEQVAQSKKEEHLE